MTLKWKLSSGILAMQYIRFKLAGKGTFWTVTLDKACLVGALDVAVFVREMMEMHPGMHEPLLQQLRVTFPQLQSPRVYTTVLWMMAEYSSSAEDVECALDTILTALGPPPFGADLKGACNRLLYYCRSCVFSPHDSLPGFISDAVAIALLYLSSQYQAFWRCSRFSSTTLLL